MVAITPRLQTKRRTIEFVQHSPQLDEAADVLQKAARKAFEQALLKLEYHRDKPQMMRFARPNPLPKASVILP